MFTCVYMCSMFMYKYVYMCIIYAAAAATKLSQSCLTLCDPIDGSPSGSSVPRILQAVILEWVAISFPNACMHAKSLQSCLTLCDPIDGSPQGSSVPGIPQVLLLVKNLSASASRCRRLGFDPWVRKIPWSRRW